MVPFCNHATTGTTYQTIEISSAYSNATFCIPDSQWFGYWDEVRMTLKQAVALGIALREIWIDQWRKVKPLAPPKQQAIALNIRRSPARKCVKDARRWKRRRFVQGLAT